MKRIRDILVLLPLFFLLVLGCGKNEKAVFSHERNTIIDERFEIADEAGKTTASFAFDTATINNLYQTVGTFVSTMESQHIIDMEDAATVVFERYAEDNPIFNEDNRAGGLGFSSLESQQQIEQAVSEIELIYGVVNRFFFNEYGTPFLNKELYHSEQSFQEVSKFIDDKVNSISRYLYLGRDDYDDEDSSCKKKAEELENRVIQDYELLITDYSNQRQPKTVQDYADCIAYKTFASEKAMVTAMLDYCHFIANRIDGFEVLSESEYVELVSRMNDGWDEAKPLR